MKLTIHPFIFTWKRHFERACKLEDQLREIFPAVTVINSDDDSSRPGWINVGDSCYFGAQFQKALELFSGDIMFHIQADAEYHDFQKLVEDAKFYFRFYEAGIYAPNVDYTWWSGDKTDINAPLLSHSNLKLVADTDETVWFIRKEVIDGLSERKIDLSINPLGWGIDCVLSCLSYSKGMPVIRDYRHTVRHPQGTGYDYPTAETQMEGMIASLDKDLQEIYGHIRGDRQRLLDYLKRKG